MFSSHIGLLKIEDDFYIKLSLIHERSNGLLGTPMWLPLPHDKTHLLSCLHDPGVGALPTLFVLFYRHFAVTLSVQRLLFYILQKHSTVN